MRDNQGNKIVEGSLLLWCISKETFEAMRGRMLVRVAKVIEPVIEGNEEGQSITLVVNIPLPTLPNKQETQLQDFYGLRSPQEEKAIEGMLQ